jgi:hypothetical protein
MHQDMDRSIPCYVSGKGMYATSTTQDFKVAVIGLLQETGLGYDTRYRYYQRQFPEMDPQSLARRICDPIEYYDQDWPAWRAAQPPGRDEQELITAFFLERDTRFRNDAKAAIYCFDEAGFGSGINVMRFINRGMPLLGFYQHNINERPVNLGNVLQLQMEYPALVSLHAYEVLGDILPAVRRWLESLLLQDFSEC